ncbi:Phospholipid-transporting ATPase [Mycena indigotica]|uniref:Phospholipid-transporting ATPase n=1 Tax=Mycena indigotica TaxID=2126181 RepID=A0A8H6SM32_9AGAR|nr:Phospholipid-transporting ATPase [Mycena indigotica]KAF7301327.1 Phospholipid-transporting ATPase [Mycena indigotica]
MADSKAPSTPWYRRLADLRIEDLFSRKKVGGPPRTVYVNQNLPSDYLDAKGKVKAAHVYPSNQVITSKYTIITFLPRNLLEQFRRIANIFFLALAILQFFPKFATVSVGVVILPLIIVLAFSAIKDGWEDIIRHRADRKMNNSQTLVLRADNWNNPNAMEAKSKTFVRAIVPQRKPRPPVITADDAVVADWEITSWEDVRVGDFVKVRDNEPIPADIFICATSEEENVAFIETKNLDGETNLKSRHAVAGLTHLNTAADCANSLNAFSVRADRPDTNMYKLNATITKDKETLPVDLTMTLLRGTVLRNTEWVIGVVLYTGIDTKIIMNSGGAPSKRSKVERQMNPQVLINLFILFLMTVACAIGDSVLEHYYQHRSAPWLYGDDTSGDNPSINGLVTWAFAFLTFQDIVPISLYISIEIVRTFQAAFIFFDKDMWYAKTDQATLAKSWNLSDDLGQIQYIFSDKTGTLTQNLMVFRQCSVGGRSYMGDLEEESLGELKEAAGNDVSSTSSAERNGGIPHFKDVHLTADLEAAVNADPNSGNAAHARSLNGFFKVLGLCHTVLTGEDPDTGALEYKAQSPDEAALVQAAADVGFVFLGRDRDFLTLRTPFAAEPERYQLLNILEFTSARKRMSVVVKQLDGADERLFLLTKGADNVIFERLKEGGDELKATTESHLSEFANGGLRTLTLAYKVIQESEYVAWNERYHEATIALEGREEKIEEISDELERDLRLLGATAIEDKLQDGVPETIADLKRAGIKIWVATGDKLETAIAIGKSTNLVTPDSNIIIIRGGNDRGRTIAQQMQFAIDTYFSDSDGPQHSRRSTSTRDGEPVIPLQRVDTGVTSIVGEHNGERPGGFILVIDGTALLHAFDGDANRALLLHLGTKCDGVICCRVSPLQKALVVKLVKDGLGAMTLAIGDGANDVSMIQAADVGVGISGEEGLQAANSSDYAIAQFRFLKKLLLVHGHWSYARNGTMILNFFYKNIVPTVVLFWFQIYNGWSATYAFAYVYVLFWNSLWTVLPVVAIGVFDRFLGQENTLTPSWRSPNSIILVARAIGSTSAHSSSMCWTVHIRQSVIIYFFLHFTYLVPTTRSDGYDTYINEGSTTMALAAVMVANMYTGLMVHAWTFWVFFALAFGICVVWGFTAIYSLISPGYAVTALYGNDHYVLRSAYFWFGMLFTFVLAFTPRYLIKAWQFGYRPNDIDMVRWMSLTDSKRDLSKLNVRGLAAMKPRPASIAASRASRRTSRTGSVMTLERPHIDIRSASTTDMATGLRSVDRGFDFATEEGGVALRRMQTNLSEKHASTRNLALPAKGKLSIKRGLRSLTRKSRDGNL